MPMVYIYNMWKGIDRTSLLADYNNLTHDYRNIVYCYCPLSGILKEDGKGDFEKCCEILKEIISSLAARIHM